jgi:hypothetical protein
LPQALLAVLSAVCDDHALGRGSKGTGEQHGSSTHVCLPCWTDDQPALWQLVLHHEILYYSCMWQALRLHLLQGGCRGKERLDAEQGVASGGPGRRLRRRTTLASHPPLHPLLLLPLSFARIFYVLGAASWRKEPPVAWFCFARLAAPTTVHYVAKNS